MDSNMRYFINLLSAFINQETIGMDRNIDKNGLSKNIEMIAGDQNIDWKVIYKLGKIHCVSGIVYLMTKDLINDKKPENSILAKLQYDFMSSAIVSSEQECEMNSIYQRFNELEIPHAVLKGYFIKNCYPVKEMRTMGDIDILIKSKDREKTHKMLISMGYQPGEQCGEVWDYTKGNTYLEIHTQIMYHNLHNGLDYVTYFSDVWEHTSVTADRFTYELDLTYHLLFMMVHIAKHFDGSGCGIRMIMDVAVYINHFREQLNWEQINTAMDELKLRLFFNNIFILCNRWFGVEFDSKLSSMDENFYEELSLYILSAGTFGFYNRNQEAKVLRNEYVISDSKRKRKGKGDVFVYINAFWKTFFPSYEQMAYYKPYSFIKDRPYLMPAGWIYRFFYCLFISSKNPFKRLILIGKSKRESAQQVDIIKQLGLTGNSSS